MQLVAPRQLSWRLRCLHSRVKSFVMELRKNKWGKTAWKLWGFQKGRLSRFSRHCECISVDGFVPPSPFLPPWVPDEQGKTWEAGWDSAKVIIKKRLSLIAHSSVNNATALISCSRNGIAFFFFFKEKNSQPQSSLQRVKVSLSEMLSSTHFLHQNVKT